MPVARAVRRARVDAERVVAGGGERGHDAASSPQPTSSTRAGAGGRCDRTKSVKSTEVSLAEARRIAVRSQLLDGTATSVLETVRRLGFLQLDPISTVAPPQHLVLWSRLGPFDRAELDRLLWEERKLVEWRAFLWPIEDLPLLQARMRAARVGTAPETRRRTSS